MQGFFVGGILQCRRDSLRKARRAQAQAGTEYKKAPRKWGFFITFCAGAIRSEKRRGRKPKPEPNIRKPHGSGGFLLHSVQAQTTPKKAENASPSRNRKRYTPLKSGGFYCILCRRGLRSPRDTIGLRSSLPNVKRRIAGHPQGSGIFLGSLSEYCF